MRLQINIILFRIKLEKEMFREKTVINNFKTHARTCGHAHTHTHTHTHAHTHTHTHTHTHILHARNHTHTHKHTHMLFIIICYRSAKFQLMTHLHSTFTDAQSKILHYTNRPTKKSIRLQLHCITWLITG